MPIYEYRCENGHTFEAFQSMSDDALDSCEVCEASAQRLLSAPAVHFKGSGFYTTDYARKGAKKPASGGGTDGKPGSGDSSSAGSASEGSSSSSGSSDSSGKSGSESKPAKASSSSSD